MSLKFTGIWRRRPSRNWTTKLGRITRAGLQEITRWSTLLGLTSSTILKTFPVWVRITILESPLGRSSRFLWNNTQFKKNFKIKKDVTIITKAKTETRTPQEWTCRYRRCQLNTDQPVGCPIWTGGSLSSPATKSGTTLKLKIRTWALYFTKIKMAKNNWNLLIFSKQN